MLYAGNRSLPILETCSNQVNLRSAILKTKVLFLLQGALHSLV